MWGKQLVIFKVRGSICNNLYEKNIAAPWNLRTTAVTHERYVTTLSLKAKQITVIYQDSFSIPATLILPLS
jgi:hypothetical protein